MSLIVVDQNLTEGIYSLTRDNPTLQSIVYPFASGLIYLLPIALVWLFWQKSSRWVAVKIFIGAIITWQVMSKLAGEFLYTQFGFRDRPFALFGIKELLLEQPQKSFPSDHAAVLLFVTCALFYYRQKTWAWIFLVATVLSSVARVMIGFHFVGDILGGWLIGFIGFGLLVYFDRPLQKLLEKVWNLITGKNFQQSNAPETS
ncbi:MAG: phosphatase PAP2 family protein [bacterium]|nr:phosphatase PAP2 family protein [bacterium]